MVVLTRQTHFMLMGFWFELVRSVGLVFWLPLTRYLTTVFLHSVARYLCLGFCVFVTRSLILGFYLDMARYPIMVSLPDMAHFNTLGFYFVVISPIRKSMTILLTWMLLFVFCRYDIKFRITVSLGSFQCFAQKDSNPN